MVAVGCFVFGCCCRCGVACFGGLVFGVAISGLVCFVDMLFCGLFCILWFWGCGTLYSGADYCVGLHC